MSWIRELERHDTLHIARLVHVLLCVICIPTLAQVLES